MTKRAKVYQILTFVFGISLIILLLFMGITAVQKSMKLNIGFEVKPTFLCEIELNGEKIFSNHDENAAIANGADLTGNTLTLNQTFYADLGAELTFTLYNYSEFKTKVSVKNTDKFAILPAYANGTASSGTITLDTPSGNVELVFEELQDAYDLNISITYDNDTYIPQEELVYFIILATNDKGLSVAYNTVLNDNGAGVYAPIWTSPNIAVGKSYGFVFNTSLTTLVLEGAAFPSELVEVDSEYKYIEYLSKDFYYNTTDNTQSINLKIPFEYNVQIFPSIAGVNSYNSAEIMYIDNASASTNIKDLVTTSQKTSFTMPYENAEIHINAFAKNQPVIND